MPERTPSTVDRLVRVVVPPIDEDRFADILRSTMQQLDLPVVPLTDRTTPPPRRSISRRTWFLAAAALIILAAGIVGVVTLHSSPTRQPTFTTRPPRPLPTVICWNGSVVGNRTACPNPPVNDSPPVDPHGCVHVDVANGSKNVWVEVLQAWSDPDGDRLSIASVAAVSKNGVKTYDEIHDGTPTVVYDGDAPGTDFIFFKVTDGVNPPVQGACEIVLHG